MSEAHRGQGKFQFGSNIASASRTKTIESSKARWGDMLQEGEDGILPLQKPKPIRSGSSVVQENTDIRKGWELQYVKPQDPFGVVVITKDEWNERSKIWQNALVGHVLGIKPSFKDMANFVNNQWKEFQVPKAFILRNGVFLFDFVDNDAKQAVLEKKWTFNDHPLMLKQWTPNVDLDNLDVSKILVWLQFPDLHLSLWKPKSLGKIASYLGILIATDALTSKRQRVLFARMLVEVEFMEQLLRLVPMVGPKGIFQQPLIFEWAHVRFGKCNNLGHEEMNCRAKTRKIWVVKQPIIELVQHKVLVPNVEITTSKVKAQVVNTTSDQLLKMNSEVTSIQLEKTDYHCGTIVVVQNYEKIDLVENAIGSKGNMQEVVQAFFERDVEAVVKSIPNGKSPSLDGFTVVMEYLTRKLQELETDAHFRFHAKCKTMKLTHLIFADDVVLFCKVDEKSLALMMHKFDEFLRVFGLEVYWSGALLLPKKVLKNINSACRNFIRSGKWNQSAMALVAWDDMCTPKCEGGLGIKQLDMWNRATLSKLVWLICKNHDNIWVCWAKQVLLKGKNFWEVEIPTNCAWTWRQVLKLRPVLKKYIWVQVGDGRQTSLFYDWWMGESRLNDNLSSSDISTWGHDLLVCDWWNGKEWSIPDSFVRRHPHIVEVISQQSLSRSADVALWKATKNDGFSELAREEE
ncbi:hypothetical protein SLEP1_g33443 [Rubroshorea leprosula]|uniref:DUF4283 domain-containing protein n=1 Tax=Rubroshorea leprosula TaxID=152421 RepID=A0AAV5KGL3_9ROSI|nr:hypothetical protein SLEP1_g33443 [Rubroshorea leprosula]